MTPGGDLSDAGHRETVPPVHAEVVVIASFRPVLDF
jgi:hypothetical protein